MDEHSTQADRHNEREEARGAEQDREFAAETAGPCAAGLVEVIDEVIGRDEFGRHELSAEWRALREAANRLAAAEERIWRK